MTDEQTFLSQGQGDRFDRWVEFFSAIVLALATALTAWCGYQAAQWDGEQATAYTEAIASQVEAARLDGRAATETSIEIGLFTQWAEALSTGNDDFADFLYQRFPPTLVTASEAWLATEPLTNPDAPPSPFDMPVYIQSDSQAAQASRDLAEQQFNQANEYNEISDMFVLLTVLFATVLFFAGVSGKFQWRVLDMVMLITGVIVMMAGVALILSSPMIL